MNSFCTDLFEVVDRRAKLVVNELAEEQKNSPGGYYWFHWMYFHTSMFNGMLLYFNPLAVKTVIVVG